MKILGIDPGHKGALCMIDTDRKELRVAAMPIIVEQRSEKNKTFVDGRRLHHILTEWDPALACIEDVFSMPHDGVVSAFSFGEGKGVLKGVLAAMEIDPFFVSPNRWKNDLKTSSNKDHSKALARTLLPHCKKLLSSEGKCEAALITLWYCLHLNILPNEIKPRT